VSRLAAAGRAATLVGTALAVAGTAHTAVNLRLLRVPPADPPPARERVSVLLPVRDEAARVAACLTSLLVQQDVPDLEVLVLDDGSTDGTADVVRRVAGDDARVRLLDGAPPPYGWLGKPHACRQLADAASGSVLVFVDADVVVAARGIAATVAVLRESRLDLVCPYPRQLAGTPAERLVQPLLQWSWLTTLPLRAAEGSPRPSLAAANGQLLAVDTAAYRRAGGHAAVRDEVLDDIALLRAVKRAGGRGGVVDGTHVATCRMYDGWASLREGYAKSLWSAFGSPPGAAAALGVLTLTYVVPPVAALGGSPAGRVGYAAAVVGRALVARRTGGRVVPDVLSHPAAILVLGWLTAQSWQRRRRGTLTWKGRHLS
jgi:glycosyltransferase involved in cell wall biosynthesis